MILDQVHYIHQSVEKHVFKPEMLNIGSELRQISRTWSRIVQYARKPSGTTRETAQPHDIPSRAWEVVGTDLLNCNNHEYLIIADYYSKFPIISKMNGLTTSNMVISTMKQIFSEHGIPSRVVSDNGPQYSTEAFKEFAQQWQFDHIISSPKFPKSNRFIERQIQTIKKALIKAKQAGRDPNLAMLCLWTTPINHNLPSPAELWNNRILRSNLIAKVLTARFSNTDHIREELKHRQDMQKMYHDRKAHDLPPLVPGQDVRILDNQTGKWKPAIITSRCPNPRSYILQLSDGSSKRRNRVEIRAAETSSHKQVHFNDHIPSLHKGHTNTNNISHQRSIKQPICNTRNGREIHRPKRYKTNKQGI